MASIDCMKTILSTIFVFASLLIVGAQPILRTPLTTNAANPNQFLSGSLKEGALLTNTYVYSSNNTSRALVVTNHPGATVNFVEMYTTNRTGFRLQSNGMMEIRANAASGTNPVLIADNVGGSGQTYLEFRNSGVASFVMRGDSSGNAVLSAMGSSGDFYLNYDGGGGDIHFGKAGVGDLWFLDGTTYNLHPGADNTRDFGQGARRVRNIWTSGTITNDGSVFKKAGTATSLYAKVGGTIFSSTTLSTNTSTTESMVFSNQIPANVFDTDQHTVSFEFGGEIFTSINNKRIQLYYGTNIVIWDSTSQNPVASTMWRVQGNIKRSSATTIRASVGLNTTAGNIFNFAAYTNVTVSCALAQPLYITLTGGATGEAYVGTAHGRFEPAP